MSYVHQDALITRPGTAPVPAAPRRRQRRRRRLRAFLRRGIRRSDNPARWVLSQVGAAALLGLAGTVLVLLMLRLGGLGTGFWPLWAVLSGGLLTQWLVGGVRPPPPVGVPLLADDGAADLSPRPLLQAERWERRLSTTNEDPEWYTRVVRDRLVTLVADRLRLRHGLVLGRDPDRDRAVLGEALHAFLTGPVTRAPDPAGLGRLISQMEEI